MTKDVTVDGRVYTVRELAVWEIRNWIQNLQGADLDLIDELLIEGIQLSAVREMAGISKEDFDAMTPSELDKIVDVAKQVNLRFFAMVDRVVAASKSARQSPS
jgi:hypothetical protein